MPVKEEEEGKLFHRAAQKNSIPHISKNTHVLIP
jgi:hypothetical protein